MVDAELEVLAALVFPRPQNAGAVWDDPCLSSVFVSRTSKEESSLY